MNFYRGEGSKIACYIGTPRDICIWPQAGRRKPRTLQRWQRQMYCSCTDLSGHRVKRRKTFMTTFRIQQSALAHLFSSMRFFFQFFFCRLIEFRVLFATRLRSTFEYFIILNFYFWKNLFKILSSKFGTSINLKSRKALDDVASDNSAKREHSYSLGRPSIHLISFGYINKNVFRNTRQGLIQSSGSLHLLFLLLF